MKSSLWLLIGCSSHDSLPAHHEQLREKNELVEEWFCDCDPSYCSRPDPDFWTCRLNLISRFEQQADVLEATRCLAGVLGESAACLHYLTCSASDDDLEQCLYTKEEVLKLCDDSKKDHLFPDTQQCQRYSPPLWQTQTEAPKQLNTLLDEALATRLRLNQSIVEKFCECELPTRCSMNIERDDACMRDALMSTPQEIRRQVDAMICENIASLDLIQTGLSDVDCGPNVEEDELRLAQEELLGLHNSFVSSVVNTCHTLIVDSIQKYKDCQES